MCTRKAPTIVNPDAAKRDPIYMRNMYLDGLGINSEQKGRNSLRIDQTGQTGSAWDALAAKRISKIEAPARVPVTTSPVASPALGIGGRG